MQAFIGNMMERGYEPKTNIVNTVRYVPLADHIARRP